MLKESVTQFFLQCNFLFYVLLMKQKWEMKFVQYLPKNTMLSISAINLRFPLSIYRIHIIIRCTRYGSVIDFGYVLFIFLQL